jgi:hypothetical protein
VSFKGLVFLIAILARWPPALASRQGQGLSREPEGGHHNIGFRCAR